MKPVSCVLFLLAVMLCGQVAYAGDYQSDRETLRGITGLDVVIEDIAPKAERNGLTVAKVRTDVELKLRLAGIRVFTEQEWLEDTTNAPMYCVDVHILVDDDPPYYTYSVSTSVYERVYLVRTWEQTWGQTWSIRFLGYTSDLRTIRDTIKDQVDRFINAFLSVNPNRDINQSDTEVGEDG